MSGRSSDRGRGRGRGRGSQSLPFRSQERGGGGGSGRGTFGRGRGGPSEVEVFSQDGQISAVDLHVRRTENETELKAKKAVTISKISSSNFPQRPGFGTLGREVLLWANYFEFVSSGDLVLYRYSIEIRPEKDKKTPAGKKARRIVQLLIEEHFLPHDIATDFKSTLISRNSLQIEDDGYIVVYRSEDEDDPAPNAKQYRVRLESTGTLTVSELINHLTSSQAGLMFGSKDEILQALNIVVGHHPKAASTIATVASNRHFDKGADPQYKVDLGSGIQAIRGFFLSVRAATARILVNVQIKNMAFYEEGLLDGIMNAYGAQNKLGLAKFLKRLTVDAAHITRTNKSGRRIPRIKTIQGLASKDDGRRQLHPPIVPQFGANAKEVQFYLDSTEAGSSATPKSHGGKSSQKGKKNPKVGPESPSQSKYISVYDFFKQQHGITLKDPNLPVVNVGTKDNPSYLPAQVCIVMPGQPAMSKLSPAQTQQMIRFAVRRPTDNARAIVTSGGRLLGFDPKNATLQAFDINITPKLITVPGRVLMVPAIKYAGKQIVSPRFGSWNMKEGAEFVTKAQLPKWTYLRISLQQGHWPWRGDAEFRNTLDNFQTMLRRLGMSVANYMNGQHILVDSRNLESAVETAIHKFASHPQNRPTLILVIVPEREMRWVYNRVKYVCDIQEGMLNVCVLDTKFSRANEQYFANVGLKFNLKLGGRNHSLDPSKVGILKERKTMVVGIDVTHPSPGSSSGAPSVAGIVASVDEWLGQWPAELRIQPAREEMVEGLQGLFESRLRLWMKRNGNPPENIIFYRDGVSEGQYNLVLEKELPALQDACKKVYPGTMIQAGKPRLSIIIVGKRHNTRFYATKKDEADRSGNPQNGTVVDRGVTEARNWDFFLQSHAAIQGTARPAHYYMVYDEIFREQKVLSPFNSAADALEDLTHNMCYLFGRATKAVSICPPAYYADLVCERARCYLSQYYDASSAPSPTTSVAGSSTGSVTRKPDPSLVKVHEKVRDTMFYI